MRAYFEHVDTSPDTSWKILVVQGPEVPFTWHFHPEFELSLIVRGTGTRFVGDSITHYQAGELVMIGSELPHAFVSTPGDAQEAIVVQFRGDFLGSELFQRPEFSSAATLLERSRRGLRFGNGVPTGILSTLPDLPPAQRTLALLEILLDLADRADADPLASELHPGRLDRAGGDRINAILRLLRARYATPVSLAEVADAAHLTPAATSRFFRRTTGVTITGYLNMVRVGVACRLLVDTDLPITEIAAEAGYQNLSHFNRTFRTMKGIPPRAYRARFRQ